MTDFASLLSPIDDRAEARLSTLRQWSNINSGSTNLPGLSKMASVLKEAFEPLGGIAEILPPDEMTVINQKGEAFSQITGNILRIRKRESVNRRIMLVGHMDTVFSETDRFQTCTDLDEDKLGGPGVADMKGGLLVMLGALGVLESSPYKDQIGWEVLINADEEIGSFGSARYLTDAAKSAHTGFVFEPSLPDGTLAGARKGSGNFTIVVKGLAAHAGRDHHLGRNAIVALSAIITKLDALSGGRPGLTVNVGKIDGGGALNVVPDLAITRLNVRMELISDQNWFMEQLSSLINQANAQDGITADLHGSFSRPPKPFNEAQQQLFDLVQSCGADLGFNLSHKPTGGCCDGNNLAAAGLPNIDTLGVRGANIHSPDEYMIKESLTERTKLTSLILLKLASGEAAFPPREVEA